MFSQTINGRLVQEANNNPFDSVFTVILQVKLNDGEAETLGHAFNLKFDYDTLAIQFDNGIYLNFNEANGYTTQPILSPGGSYTIQNIETELTSGNGQQVTDSWIDFAMFNFTILDFSLQTYVCPHNNAWGFHFYSPNSVDNQDWTIGLWECYEGNVPVELTSFTANVSNGNVILSWATATETNNSGFEIERDGNVIGFVPGFGTTTEPKAYSFTDNPTGGNTFTYRLKQVDFDGTYEYFDAIEVSFNVNTFTLYQNYPNPFNPSTMIKYELNEAGNVSLKIYDVLGKEVSTLVNEYQTPGIYEVNFNANNTATALYIYELRANDNVITKKMTLLK
jgi:hypothetical protein